MKPTIKDVAKRSGVSISTVSRVLNTPELVTETKREKVLKVIETLGYHPNALARGLIQKRTHSLGVLIPDVSNLVFAEVFRGMEDAAHETGQNLVICNTDLNKERMMSYFKILKEKQVDGMIFTSEPVYPDYYELLKELQIPVVLAATHSHDYELPSVKVNDEPASYDATAYLIKMGHRHIGMISGPSHDPIAGLPRMQGFLRAMRMHDLPHSVERNVVYGHYRYEDGYEAMEELYQLNDKLSAVLCASDEMALGAISYLDSIGINVPEDVSVMGYDNTRLAHVCIPKLTTVSQPLHAIGYEAVNKLEMLLSKGEVDELRTYLPHQLVIRDSVKAP
ncbi:LacI family DNA-binding transcriptional regulator [Caldalkalibacillus salinus]|uniref:LacI family DNA-binding transcriptional regulator n=1 Tax=Caldalkalibacillus salinus TaxID=2803787 RepID=UPI001923C6AE|nr:substrate-binding domain-containing protein [Caldalkalibacillus salinus]